MSPADPDYPGGEPSPLRVLFLEDNEDDVELCLRELRRAGFVVRADVVQSPDEFARRLQAGRYDVILADYFLPAMTGMDALALLKQRGRDIPLILVTGLLGDEQAVECLKQGARDYVLKQRLARLPGALRRALEETQLREAEKRARDGLAQLAAIVESSHDAIVGCRLDGTVATWNSGAESMYGYTAAEAVGRPVSMIIPPDRLLTDRLHLDRPEASKHIRQHESVRVRKDGRRLPVLLTVSPVKNADGQTVAISEIAHDITERKRLEAQLRAQNRQLEEQNRKVKEANRLKSQFLANMSHELRSPLNGIIGLCQMLQDGRIGSMPEEQKELLGDVLNSSNHLLQLINGLLDLAKVESGKLEFHPAPVSVEELAREVARSLQAVASAKGIQLGIDVAPGLEEVLLDPDRTKQVLYNYLSNALKFTPEGGRVVVRAKAEPPHRLRLEVEDTGIGIASEDMVRLFRNFEQIDNSPSKKFQGSGLGLALTKRIVEAQGGRVWARSTPGHGSTFCAVLPRTVQRRHPQPAAPAYAVSGVRRVGEVDD